MYRFIVPLLVLVITNEAWGQPSFRGLGRLPDQRFGMQANGVSADGTVVVGSFASSDSDPNTEAFRWTQESGIVGLGDLTGFPFHSDAYAVSADGTVIVGSGNGSPSGRAFRWTHESGMMVISGADSRAWDVSADGSVVVGGRSQPGTGFETEAFIWTQEAGAIRLDDFPAGVNRTEAKAVSADGSLIVGQLQRQSIGREAFLWHEKSGFVGLGDLDGGVFSSDALDVSADGSVIVGWGTVGVEQKAFIWDAKNGMIGLGDFPGAPHNSRAKAVSANGSIVVGVGTNETQEAFIWDATNGMRNLKIVLEEDFGLDLTGWILLKANDISDNGRFIVGDGYNPSGGPDLGTGMESWIVDLGCLSDDHCDDGIACTVDSCDLATHICSHNPDDTLCDDSLFCSGVEICDVSNGCQNGKPACDDEIVCTVDSCDETAQECTNVTQDTMCDDGAFCNGVERCHPSLGCLGSSPPDCDDGNDCTDDSCDLDSDDCDHVELIDGTTCEDGFVCTLNDSCLDAVCVSGGINPLCVGSAGPSGGAGSQGAPGSNGISCWDVDGDGVADPEEDVNDDGDYNSLDCVGPEGPQGPAGVSCWDLNGNGIGEPAEDTNGDGNFDAFDCQGVAGRSCEDDTDCQDGLFCNGEEQCDDDVCTNGPLPCDLDNETCMEDGNRCIPADIPAGQDVPTDGNQPAGPLCGTIGLISMVMMFMGLASIRLMRFKGASANSSGR